MLKYSPRYFGANALPFPELMGGKLSPRWEVELRGEYHKMTGDKTKDVFARLVFLEPAAMENSVPPSHSQ